MNLSLISPHSFVGRTLRLPLRFIPAGMVIPILSGPLRGYRWIVGSSIHGCWLGTYEQSKQKAVARALRSEMVFFDIGANVGFYSLLAAAKGCRVFAFEPSRRNLEYLYRHVEINHFDSVRVLAAAVGDHMGTALFSDGEDPSTGSLSASGYEVKLISIDTVPQVPDVIKIDVEGAEYFVLKGGERVITSAMPMIFLATHGAEVHQRCCDLLSKWGYRLQIDGDEVIASPR